MAATTVTIQDTNQVISLNDNITLLTSNPIFALSVKTANYTITYFDQVILVNANSGNIGITLPTAVGHTGIAFYIKRIDSAVNSVTINTTSSQTIDGASSRTIGTQYESITVVSDGANWAIL